MADIMLTADLNLTPVEQKLKSFQSQLNALQAQNASAGVKVPQLPAKVLQQIAKPTTTASKGDAAAISAAVKQQGELVALKLQELAINKRLLTGQAFDIKSGEGKAVREQLQSTARQSLEGQLGFSLSPAQAGQLTKAVNQFFAQIAAQLESVPLTSQAAAFKELTASKLAAQGIGPVAVKDVGTVVKSAAAQDKVVQAKNEEANAAQITAAEAEILAARERIALAEAQVLADREAVAATGRRRVTQNDPGGFNKQINATNELDSKIPAVSTQTGRTAFGLTDEEFKAAFGSATSALKGFAAQITENTTEFALGSEQYLKAVYDITARMKAEADAAILGFRGQATQALVNDPELLAQAGRGQAESLAGRATINAEAQAALTADEALNAQLLNAKSQIVILTKEQAAALAAELAANEAYINSTAATAKSRLEQNISVKQALLADDEYVALLRSQTALNASQRHISNPSTNTGFVNRLKGIGSREGGAGDFFGAGFATTLKYALPSAALFGSLGAITSAVKDSEELQVSFTKIQSQLKSIGAANEFPQIKQDIIDLSKSSGIEASKLADVFLQIQGAFGDLKFNSKDTTGSLGGLRGSDDLIRYGQDAVKKQTEAAAKLSVVTGISQDELVDGLTAASIAFGASADRIGDVAVKLETATGVKAKETISFLGDIGPSAREAGFSLEEFAAIAAQVQKRSGQSGATIAEQLGRVLAAIKGNKSDFLDIANSNQEAFGGNYQDFIKNVQQGNTREVFNQLAVSFESLNQSSKDFIVNLIGGQRQANTLLAAFGDSAGLSKTIDAAKSGAGELDARYAKLQQRISIILTRLKTGFNDLVKQIVDSGLGDIVADVLHKFEGILKVITAAARLIGGFNRILGGVPAKVAAIALEFAAIQKVISFIAETSALRGLRGGGLAGAGRGVGRGALGLAGGIGGALFPAAPGAFQKAYRDQLIKSSQKNLPGMASSVVNSQSISNLEGSVSKAQQVGARLKASGSGLLAAFGGPVGVGLTAAFAGYEIISNQVEKDKQTVADLRVRLANSHKTGEELIKEAQSMRVKRSGWYTFWHGLFNLPTPEDVTEVRGIKKEYDKRVKPTLQASQVDPKKLANLVRGPGGGKSPVFTDYYTASDPLNITSQGESNFNADIPNPQNKSDFARLRKILKKLNLKKKNINSAVAAILLGSKDKDLIKNLNDLYNGDVPEASQGAAEVLAAINKLGSTDPTTSDLFNSVKDPYIELSKASNEKLLGTIDAVQGAFDSGDLSLTKYIDALKGKLTQLQGIKPEDRTAEEAKAISNIQKQIADTYTKAILARQEQATAIQKALGQSDTSINLTEISNNLANLNDSQFTDTDARQQAALSVLAQTRDFYKNILQTTDDLALAQKLLNEGYDIPPEVRQAILQKQVEESDAYKDVKSLVQTARTDEKLSKRFNIPDKGPSGQLKDFLTQFFSADGVGQDTIDELQKRYTAESKALQNDPRLTDTQKKAIQGDLEFVAQLLGLLGIIPTGSTGRPNVDTKTGAGTGTNKPAPAGGSIFGQKPIDPKGQFAADSEERKKRVEAESKVQDALFNYAKAQANANAVEIAQIERQQANAQLQRAQSLSGLDRQEAELNAKAAQVQADQSLAKAIKDISDAKFGLAKAVADSAGDTVASAGIDVQQAQANLSFAQGTGDQAGILNAQAQIVQAQEAQRRAMVAQRDAQASLLRTVVTRDNPITQAQFDLNLAKIQEQEAKGITEKAQAAQRVVEAENALRDAMANARQAIFGLREAQLQALDDEVGAANVSAQAARAQLQDALARGAGPAEIAQLQGAVVSADKNARDTLFQHKLDEYKYLLDTNKITKSQYISYLEALQQTLIPGSKQFKDLEVTLRQLKNDIGQDLQSNLPTTLALPTLYVGRRLDQSRNLGSGSGTQIGYQDSRVQDIKVYVNNGMTGDQVVQVLSDVLGTGRNSNTPSRY